MTSRRVYRLSDDDSLEYVARMRRRLDLWLWALLGVGIGYVIGKYL